ncbi:hypothetical protein [Pedosphaera parvula]|nr:hypothetical protein [Pedosphaera parvula]
MKTLRLILVTCFGLSAIIAHAADKIEGAFGKKLGDVFDVSTAVGTSKLTDGTPMYEFATTNGFRSFNRYYVLVTPRTKKIYSVWGIGQAESTAAAQKEQALVMEILQQKYGNKEKEGILDALGDAKRIDQGSRYIVTKISGFTDVTLDIRYHDRDLDKLAERERLEDESKKVDKSGL